VRLICSGEKLVSCMSIDLRFEDGWSWRKDETGEEENSTDLIDIQTKVLTTIIHRKYRPCVTSFSLSVLQSRSLCSARIRAHG
jgi:hypothetical protein